MKYTLVVLFLLFLRGIYPGWDGNVRENQDLGNHDAQQSEVASKVALGDPFIMLWRGKYYAYGTASPHGISVYVSDDLLTWTVPPGANNGLALNKENVWGDRWFWAPEVYYIEGKFFIYYSADEHICVATSASPLGPFTQEIRRPMIFSFHYIKVSDACLSPPQSTLQSASNSH